MKVGIVGCGMIGSRRAMKVDSDDQIAIVCDVDEESAKSLAEKCHCEYTLNWEEVVSDPQVEVVVIATIHKSLAEITRAALEQGKHVLVEKPAARNAHELKPVVDFYQEKITQGELIAKVGFNHRFHPAMQKAKAIVDRGDLGDLMFIRGRYGHGGRVGYDKEWRAKPELSGGGELLDQGMHLIDLSRWYMGDFSKVQGTTKTYFWDMPVDDNAFMTLETEAGQVSQLHVTWTEWKNLFSLEIYGKVGKLHIEGLGKSYGTERLAFYQMKPQMGPPETTIYEYPGEDFSWEEEWHDFKQAIRNQKRPCGDLLDAYQALKIVESVYQQQPSTP